PARRWRVRRLHSASVTQTADVPTRPCAHCGRPVPQRSSAGRPFRYCRDNDGACQRAYRNMRMRQRTAPGLAGQVARAFEVVDRLDQVVATLTDALHAELSPAGVERQIAEIRAEAAAQVAAAHAERDEARREAEQARAERDDAERRCAAAAAQAEQDRAAAAEATSAASRAQAEARDALAARDEAVRAATAAEALRAQAGRGRDAARARRAAPRREPHGGRPGAGA